MESKKSNCTEISFMIFRTGSILIVGHCDEYIVEHLYDFISNLLKKEYFNIKTNGVFKEKPKKNEPKSKKELFILQLIMMMTMMVIMIMVIMMMVIMMISQKSHPKPIYYKHEAHLHWDHFLVHY